MKLELVMVPVTDVDRAKEFYEKVGFVVDHDHAVSDDVRFVQLTPPGSACSIAIGKGLTQLEPGSLEYLPMVVPDAEAVRAGDEGLSPRGACVSRRPSRPTRPARGPGPRPRRGPARSRAADPG
jgi:catechol 2,3-dioxygenase-like lactoylglutathione lyase family enzyme